MMLNNIHISIRRALIVFVLVFVASASAVAFSYAYLDSVSADEVAMKNNMRIWKNKIDEAKANNETIVEHEKTYLSLIDYSIFGEENRLSWFEALQSTASSRGLDMFRFSVASQTKIDTKDINPAYSSIEVYKSVMNLNMKVSHEGDIFAVFNDLNANAKGLYSVDSCTINKIKNTKSDGAGAKMDASCNLIWYTFRPIKSKG